MNVIGWSRAALAVGVGLGIALAVACGPEKACGPSNCTGCCTAAGKCELGSIPQACGATGGLCQTCNPTDLCTNGVCLPTGSTGGTDAGGGGKDAGTDGGVIPGTDAGTDAGTGADAGSDGGVDPGQDAGTDAGVVLTGTVGLIRSQAVPGQRVVIPNAVVTAVSFTQLGTTGGQRAEFWVADLTQPRNGIWVEKYYSDLPVDFVPTVGDQLSIEGWFSPVSSFWDRSGYRAAIRNDYAFGGTNPLVITWKANIPQPAPLPVYSGSFGNAVGGSAKPNLEYAGARVHIAGPLTVVNPAPIAMDRYNFGTRVGFNGFEVTGGILVNNYKTFGASRCDYGAIAADGGYVTFPNGISGVWDTYTHAPCVSGTPTNCTRQLGSVPGTSNDYTMVLYPQDCTTDLVGVVQ